MLGVLQEPFSRPRGVLERRASSRFPIVREVCYMLRERQNGAKVCGGKTVNISSTGVLFWAQEPVKRGKRLGLSISWPAQLDGECELKLVVTGRVVRCEGALVAIEIERYEFRTQGSGAFARLPGV